MNLIKKAEDKFGKERAEELRSELEEVESEIKRLHSVDLVTDDEP